MPNRTIPKKIKMGYRLLVNHTGEPGANNWKHVGTLFGSSLEAAQYRENRFPKVAHYRIEAVRVGAALSGFENPEEKLARNVSKKEVTT